MVSPLERTFPTCSALNFTGGFFHQWRKYTLTNKQTSTDYTSVRRARSTAQLAEQMSAEVKYYKSLFHLAFVLLKDINFMVAIEYGLSNLISSRWEKDRENQWKAIYPTNTCFYLRTRSELLRDSDRLRELSLDLSKKNRMTKFLLYKERAAQQICIGKETASQQICIGCFTNFKLAVLIAVVDRWRTFGNSAFILCRSLRLRFSMLFNQQSFLELKFSPTKISDSVFFSEFGFLSVQATST